MTTSAVTAWDKRSSNSVEQIYPGISRFWMDQGRIVCYSVTSITRPAIDAWKASTLEIVHAWPVEQPYLSIHDFSEATLTPYVRQRSAEMSVAFPERLFGRSAVIMPRTFVNHLIRMWVTMNLARNNQQIKRDVFFRLEEATEWLKKGL
jgi:hypothetical protein